MGNTFAILTALAFGLFVYGTYPKTQSVDTSYTAEMRQNMDVMIAEANGEINWDQIPRLSVDDLEW